MKDFFETIGVLLLFAVFILLAFGYGWWKYNATRTALIEKYHCEPSVSTVPE